MQDLVPQPGIEPGPPALGAQRLTPWTTGEVPTYSLFRSWWNLLCSQCSEISHWWGSNSIHWVPVGPFNLEIHVLVWSYFFLNWLVDFLHFFSFWNSYWVLAFWAGPLIYHLFSVLFSTSSSFCCTFWEISSLIFWLFYLVLHFWRKLPRALLNVLNCFSFPKRCFWYPDCSCYTAFCCFMDRISYPFGGLIGVFLLLFF